MMKRGNKLAALAVVLLGACTDANLYHRSISPAQADRVTFRGEVCTEDPQVSHFPLRVIFLVDQSGGFNPIRGETTGTLFTDFDAEGARIRAMRDVVGQYQRDETVSFAVIGFAGSPRIMAPAEGSFTRNVGELEAAIATLGIPQGCEGEDSCRDLRGALGTARSLIEGDLTALSPGARSMTRYAVILMLAGPPSPLPEGTVYCQRAIGGPACCDPSRMDCQRDLRARICCDLDHQPCVPVDPGTPPYCCNPLNAGECVLDECLAPPVSCATGVLVEDVRQMRQVIEDAGAASFHFHALHLAAELDLDPADGLDPNDDVGRMLQDMAFAGAGEFQAYYDGSGIESSSTNLNALQLLRPLMELEAKDFLVFNLNALPGSADGTPRTDTDADGLADENEAEHGTDPGRADTDLDGITDFVEVLIEYSPLSPDTPAICEGIPVGSDEDADLLTDCDEALLGTDPSLLDSDGDAMPDRLEVTMGTDYVILDWLDDADNDGVPNGDEVRQHTDPRSSDASSHLATQYRYTIVDEGLRARIEVGQPRTVTGVDVLHGSEDTAAGLGWLCYTPATEAEGGVGGWLCWLDAEELTDAGGRVSCEACNPLVDDEGREGNPIRITADGSYELPSRSHGEISNLDAVEAGEEPDLYNLVLSVEVSVADLPPRDSREQLLVSREERNCLTFVVRNVKLAATGETELVPQTGWNNIALYFAQAPQGRLSVPGIFRMALIPVRYLPPDRREPPDAELRVWDEEFFRAGVLE